MSERTLQEAQERHSATQSLVDEYRAGWPSFICGNCGCTRAEHPNDRCRRFTPRPGGSA